MMDFSQLLTQQADLITEQWIAAVKRDRLIQTADRLTHTAIQDHIPYVLEALATVLSQVEANDIEAIVQASLQHGIQRAEQGFEPTEIAREYHLLRAIILSNLREHLLQGSAEEVLRAMSLINTVVDAALAQCFSSYVSQRLHELERLQHQMALTNQELNRLVHASQENLSHLAHELKTPLTSIIGYSELFLRQHRQQPIKDSVQNLEHVERVLRNGRLLLRLINDSLELSRCEAGQFQLQPMRVDVRSVLQAALEMIQPLAVTRGLELKIVADHAPEQIWIDPLRLQQILMNLGSNAIRYTETGCVIIVCQTLNDRQWLLSVSDTGIGISPADQTKIFDPYFRVSASGQAPTADSTGLGLAIVQQLVKLLQGEIKLESELGVGSTFTVILPMEVAS